MHIQTRVWLRPGRRPADEMPAYTMFDRRRFSDRSAISEVVAPTSQSPVGVASERGVGSFGDLRHQDGAVGSALTGDDLDEAVVCVQAALHPFVGASAGDHDSEAVATGGLA